MKRVSSEIENLFAVFVEVGKIGGQDRWPQNSFYFFHIYGNYLFNLDIPGSLFKVMAKKTPRSNKKEQAEPTPRKSKITKSTKKKDQGHDGSQIQLFSEGFYAKVDEFKQLYNDINQNILGAGKDAEFNLQLKLQGVSKVLEQNCSNILKNHLEDAEKWLGEKIQAFRQKIKHLQELQGEAENIFEKTGVLDKEEIKQSLAALQEKIVQERGSLQHFENLHARSKAVYE